MIDPRFKSKTHYSYNPTFYYCCELDQLLLSACQPFPLAFLEPFRTCQLKRNCPCPCHVVSIPAILLVLKYSWGEVRLQGSLTFTRQVYAGRLRLGPGSGEAWLQRHVTWARSFFFWAPHVNAWTLTLPPSSFADTVVTLVQRGFNKKFCFQWPSKADEVCELDCCHKTAKMWGIFCVVS